MKLKTRRDHAIAALVLEALERRMTDVTESADFVEFVKRIDADTAQTLVLAFLLAAEALARADLEMSPHRALAAHAGMPRLQ